MLLTNTASLFTMVFPGRGLTTPARYTNRVALELEDLRVRAESVTVREGLDLPERGAVTFSKALNRSVTGSMNDQVFHAKLCMEQGSKSAQETAAYLNGMPMLSLEAVFPHKAFVMLATGPNATE